MAMLSSQESATPGGRSPVDAAMDVVRSAERVSVKELPDGGIAFEVEPGPHNVWKVPLACIVVGAIAIAAGYLLHVYGPGLPEAYIWRGAWKLMGTGALVLAMGPVFLLISVMQGPPRKATVEASPGILKADRSLAGDRVVSNYAAAEVERFLVDDAGLFAATPKGEQCLIGFGNREVKTAIATLLASRLWHGEEITGGPVPELYGWVIFPTSRVAQEHAAPGTRR